MIKLKVLLIILFAEIVGIAGQILYKKGVNKIGTPDLRNFNSCVRFAKKVLTNSNILLGLVVLTSGLVLWLFALAQGELSLVFTVGSMQYIMTLIAAHYLLGEKINKLKLFGTLLVMLGILFVAIS